MIKKSVFEDELIAGMQRELTANAQTEAVNNLDTAVEYLHSAMEVFEDAGLQTQADAILDILRKIASKHKKPSKHDKSTQGLTSDKMIENLLHHGTEFNMVDDGEGLDDLLNADIDGDELNVSDSELEMDFEDEI